MVVRWKFGEGRTKTRSLFKLQRSFQTCSSPPTTADRRRAPGRQLTVGPVLRPAGCSPPTSRSHHQDSECEASKAPTSSSPPTELSAGRFPTADHSLPSGLRVRNHDGVTGFTADGSTASSRPLTADQSLPPQTRNRRAQCRRFAAHLGRQPSAGRSLTADRWCEASMATPTTCRRGRG